MPITLNASTSSGLITTPDNSGQIAFQNNGTTELTVNAFGIGLGTAVPSSGTGITFPAVQDPSSNANTLDDYEEGTWTPSAATGFPSGFTSVTATYTKVGRLVTVSALATCTTDGTTIQIGGLPFAPNHNGGVASAYWGSNVLRAGVTSSFGGYITLLTSGTFSNTAVYFGATYEV